MVYLILNNLTKQHKNFKKRKLDNSYYIKTITNLLVSVCLIMLIFITHTFSNHLIPKLQNIIFYFITTDTLYYWIHRTIHKNPLLKKFFHFTHHEATKLVPFDIFYTDYKENILYLFIIYIFPLLFIQLNIIEYLIILIISFYHSYYTHSDVKNNFIIPLFINSNYHKKHHNIGGGNYSVFFNIWDEYMGSKIPKTPRLSK
jgi:4-alpha-methyl-delta7-sterol-4alpha-methyl oxidase